MATLEVSIDGSGAKRGANDVVRSLDSIRAGASNMEGAVNRSGKGLHALGGIMGELKRVAAPLAAAFGVKEIIQTINEYQGLQNQLKVVTNSVDELAMANDRLFAISQKTRTPLEATVGLYSKASIAAKELGASQEQLYQLVETTGKALAVGGVSAQEASGALRQLSQAFSSGIVRAEEFNSILEGAFPLAQAAAKGLDAAGGSVGRLRNLVVKGKVSSKEFFEAILKGGAELDKKFANTTVTIGQAFTMLGNSFTKFIGKMGETTGVSTKFAGFLQSTVKYLDELSKALFDVLTPTDELSSGIKILASGLIILGQAFNVAVAPIKLAWNNFKALGEAIGGVAAAAVQFAHGEFSAAADTIGTVFTKTAHDVKENFTNTYDDLVSGASGAIEKLNKIWDEGARNAAELKKAAKDTGGGPSGKTLAELEAEAKAAEKAAKALRDRAEALKQAVDPGYVYEKQLENINELLLTNSISQEQADAAILQAGAAYNAANPEIQKYIDMMTEAQTLTEQMRTPQEEYNASVENYMKLLDAGLITQETYNRALTDANDKMKDALSKQGDSVMQLSEFAKQGARNIQSAFADFLFDPFDSGVKGMVSKFVDALKRMAAEALAQQILTGLFNAFSGGSYGAIAGAVGAGLAGRAAGGDLQAGQAAVVGERRKPELFVPKQNGTVIPMEKLGGQNPPNVEVPVNITNVVDPESMVGAMESSGGTQAILNVINANPEVIRRALS